MSEATQRTKYPVGRAAMPQAYDRYFETKVAYERATAQVERLIAQLGKFTTPLLFNWSRYYVDANVRTPPGMMRERIRVSGQGVPSPGEIAQAMVAQFEALRSASEAWDRIPERERGELQRPSWLPK